MTSHNPGRRQLLRQSVSAMAALSLGPRLARAAAPPANRLFVGALVEPADMYETGIANALDAMQTQVGINTVMTFTHTHTARQYRPKQAVARDKTGRALTEVWVKTNAKYYANPAFVGKDPATLYADRDILDELVEAAKPRRMQVYARILEPYVITGAIPGFEAFAQTDADGHKTNQLCFNKPGYIRYWESVINDLVRGHQALDGFKFGQERAAPLLGTLGKETAATCFCSDCVALARQRHIDAKRAKQGLKALQKLGADIRAGHRPIDGNFVSFLRVLTNYPEVLAWERLWMDSREAQRKRIFRQIKRINPKVQVGWHIDHGMTWDLFMRATWNYAEMAEHSDWLSVAVYFDSMGRRSQGHYERNYQSILFGDAPESLSYPMYLSMLGYDPKVEPTLDQHRKHDTAFSADYVYRESRRAVQAVAGKAKVYVRPGFDMPGYNCDVQPKQVYDAATKALKAGADGLWCGREWKELQAKNAEAFGNAVRDWIKKRA
ncbi:MAG: hypothetical protein SF187_05925 [Deltaproteobacteria bacterium]|nr:hypothetical protein [Deltaproteobacteria bacterium]